MQASVDVRRFDCAPCWPLVRVTAQILEGPDDSLSSKTQKPRRSAKPSPSSDSVQSRHLAFSERDSTVVGPIVLPQSKRAENFRVQGRMTGPTGGMNW